MASRANRPRKKSGFGTAFLWILMFAVVGAVAFEYAGPYKGWMRPAAAKARKVIAEVMGEEPAKEPTEEEKPGTEELVGKSSGDPTSDSSDPAISTVAKTDAMTYLPNTGESTPVDLAMVFSPSDASTTPKTTSSTTPATKPGMELAEKNEDYYQRLYREYLQEELSKLERPKVGKNIKVRLAEGKKALSGRLVVLSRDRAIIKVSSSKDRSVTPKELTKGSMKRLFPDAYARKRALARLDEAMEKDGKIKKEQEAVAAIKPETPKQPTTPVVLVKPTQPAKATKPARLPPLSDYDPSYSKTPKHLGKTVTSYGNWLKYQSNRAGGAIATKIYAKQHGKDVVLYMEMSKLFLSQKRSTRSQVTDQLWHMWSRKCREKGRVRTLQNAHIVLLDRRGQIIGGSRVKDGSEVWVKR